MVNVPTNLNNLKTKVHDLDVDQLKTVSVDLKNSEVLWIMKLLKTIFNTLKTKVNNLEMKTNDLTTLIHINQYNADRHNLKKEIIAKSYQIQVV